MATSSEDNFDPFNCIVCMEYLLDKETRLLHCGHTFCLDCLQKLPDLQLDKVQCPLCRTSTQLPGNSLQNLPKNYDLQKMKDRETALKAEIERLEEGEVVMKARSACQMCQNTDLINIVHMCLDCKKQICYACVERHNKIPGLNSHCVIELNDVPCVDENCCIPHGEALKLLCEVCKELLCVSCVCHPKHNSHQDKVVDFAQAKKDLKDIYLKVRKQVDADIAQLQSYKLQEEEKISSKENCLDNVKRNCHTLSKTLEEIVQDYVEMFSIMKAPHEGTVKNLLELKSQIEHNKSQSLQLNETSDLEDFYQVKEWIHYTTEFSQRVKAISFPEEVQVESSVYDIKKRCDNKLKFMKNLLQDLENNLEKTIPGATPVPTEIKAVNQPRLLCEVKEGNDVIDMRETSEIISMDDLTVLVLNRGFNAIQRVDNLGNLVNTYDLQARLRMVSACVIENTIFFATKEGVVSKINFREETKSKFQVRPQLQLDYISAESENILFITDVSKSKIYKCNVSTNDCQEVVAGILLPKKVCIDNSDENSTKYVVTSRKQDKNIIQVFSKDWEVVNTIDNLDKPSGLAMTGRRTFYVAESGKNRILEYRLDGSFVKEVLGSKDGIQLHYPYDIAYKEPYLWVLQKYPNTIKTFIIQ